MEIYPLVTVGIPLYNKKKYLRETIDSVLSQSYTNLEIIISDNCSTDGSDIIAREYAERDIRIKFIRQEINRGVRFNFDFIVSKARGEFFAWIAADDTISSSFVEALVSTLVSKKDVVLASSDVLIIDNAGNSIKKVQLKEIREGIEWRLCKRHFFQYPIRSDVFFAIYGMYRTAILKKISLVELRTYKSLERGTEIPFLARVARYGKIVSVPLELKQWRIVDNSVYHDEMKAHPDWNTQVMVSWYIRLDLIKVVVMDKEPVTQKLLLLREVLRGASPLKDLIVIVKSVMRSMRFWFAKH